MERLTLFEPLRARTGQAAKILSWGAEYLEYGWGGRGYITCYYCYYKQDDEENGDDDDNEDDDD